MKSIDRGLEWLCETAALVCGSLLILSAFYVSADLIVRKVFNLSFIGANETSGYVLAISSTWAFSYALLKRSHIRIDIVYQYLSPRWQAAVDVLSVAALAGFAAIFTWYATHYFFSLLGKGTRSITSLAVPLWIPMLPWLLGWALFLLVSIYLTVVSARALVRNELAAVRERVGAISEDEEASLELDPDAPLASARRRS